MSKQAYASLVSDKLKRKAEKDNKGLDLPWDEWLKTLFPNLFFVPFTARHSEFWQHIDSIQAGIKPPAFFAIWPRGSGKSTNVEAAAVRLGAKETRRFCLYTRSTQDKANESVANIAALLESKGVGQYYPKLAERKLGKYGNSKGWRVNMLRCANGFNVVALGYDAAVRGIKIEEYRPDVIFIDDIDDKDDTLEATLKKVSTLTRDILPAGSTDAAVIGIQNLVNYSGIFTQIARDRADFLLDRIVSGPYPAVEDLDYEFDEETRRYRITRGTPTWEGQNLATCEAQMNEWGPDVFISEAQLIINKKQGRVYHQFKDPGPDAKELDYSQAAGYWHAHDFGAVNNVWGLFVKIGSTYYLIHEQKLPEGTTASKAAIIKARLRDLKVVAGYGGAKGEDQTRMDYAKEGVVIRLPIVTDVEGQIDATNRMFEKGELVICSNCVHTIDQLDNCSRDEKEGIADKSTFHYADAVRYFAGGVKRGVFVG